MSSKFYDRAKKNKYEIVIVEQTNNIIRDRVPYDPIKCPAKARNEQSKPIVANDCTSQTMSSAKVDEEESIVDESGSEIGVRRGHSGD